jgi:hypothetical protein
MRFSATIQLRTPARVLRRHGEIHADLSKPLPEMALALWEGIWLHVVNRNLPNGAVLPDFPHSEIASDIGPIPTDGGDYLPFLLEVRAVVEADGAPDDRAEKLLSLLKNPDFRKFTEILERNYPRFNSIVDYFFPTFIETIPSVSRTAKDALSNRGLTTANRIEAAPDAELLGISGIGRSKLDAIRKHCAATASYRDALRAAHVIR